jgi:hypothetical protein
MRKQIFMIIVGARIGRQRPRARRRSRRCWCRSRRDQPGRSRRDRSARSASRDCSFGYRFALALDEQVEIEDDA